MRAAHLFVDDAPAILEDWVALSFIGKEYEEVFRQIPDTFRNPVLSAIRAMIVIRCRWAEDLLAKAMTRGATQYVILSAGLDSFAYRRRDLEEVLRVYEVDIPKIQEEKRTRLSELGISIPGNLIFVPADLEKQSLAEALTASGFQSSELAFFSWLGATEYVTEEAVFSTLKDVAVIAATGSEITLQYFLPERMVEEEDRPIWAYSRKTCTDQGEPWLSFFEPDRLASVLKEMKYCEITDFRPKDAFAPYLKGRRDTIRPHNAAHLMRARVGPRA
jgi:methyltransferase (TIGR00027 family)